MKRIGLKKKRIETDVLCIGGGIAGLVAAIRAAECGATAKSGNGNSLGNVLMGNSVFALCFYSLFIYNF